jgi:valyl-tRNA synthetase
MALAPKPDFHAIEKKWQKFWLDKNIYAFDKKSKKPVFSIDTPPPYISGFLHMGHGVSYTGFEFIARYKRMTGHNVFFPIGFDDNGHPTERYVEQKHKIRSTDMPREKFIELCLKETEALTKVAKEQLTSLGHSYDWSLFYSTISPSAVKVAQQSFLDLHKKQLVYRAEQPTLFCVHDQTALSQADVEDEERETVLNFINFNITTGKDKIQIATTRPELLPACVAILVHPDDKRYKKFHNKSAIVPIFSQRVSILPDETVIQEFGTGAVMVCTFGDKTDFEWWKKHKLPLRICLAKDGKLNELSGRYVGWHFKKAREAIIEEIKSSKVLAKQEKLKQNVGVCWRCKNPVEFLPTKQWAAKVLQFKDDLLKLGNKIKWHPEYHKQRFENWVNGLQWDWTISRQRHYGVPMPLWYCAKCNSEILPGDKDLPVYPFKDKPSIAKCPKCKSTEFKPELDVFDTWFTSSMTPQIACGFNKESVPFDLRPQGYEIIRTWLFYTLYKSFVHFKEIPWKTAMVNGMVLDPKGKAMHKSAGNVINPIDLVDKYGSDALRYFASTVNVGEDAPFQEKELQHAQRLMIKLWNVAKFVEMWHVKVKKFKPTNTTDLWITSRLSAIVKHYRESFDNYNAVSARRELENFFWQEYCDYYLEMVKHRLYGDNKAEKESAEQTLYSTFYKILQMFAVFLPHITEEIYNELYKGSGKSIHLTELPQFEPVDYESLTLGSIAVEIIGEIRKHKASKGLGPGAEIEKLTVKHTNSKAAEVLDEVAKTARVNHLHIEKSSVGPARVSA